MEKLTNLDDLRTAYLYKKNNELRFTYYMFKLLKYPWLVKLMMGLANGVLKYNIPVKTLIKNTVFRIFCSGENLKEAFLTIDKLEKYKVKAVLDYVSEAENTDSVFGRNTEIIVENVIRLGKEAPGNSISVKLTGLEDQQFFKLLSKTDNQQELVDPQRILTLTNRLDAICKAAAENNVLVYIDAEDRYMQDAMDNLVEQMMKKYNKKEAIVYNTLQMYLTDRLEYLDRLIKDSKTNNYFPGIKLVRGAYVEKEREAARVEGIKSPVFETKPETDAAFDKAVEICLKNHEHVYTCIASHNQKSTIFGMDCIAKYDIQDHYKKVKFSQLFGMSDNLTFNLASTGYNASKYLPYGEIKKAIPYLIRRAEENSSISGHITGELDRLQHELDRRKSRSKDLSDSFKQA